MDAEDPIRLLLDKTARTFYGKLLAALSARSRDIAACEDALSEAFRKALVDWKSVIPDNPEAWLFKVAKNHLIDGKKRERFSTEFDDTQILMVPDKIKKEGSESVFKDERLKLMFVCCHPSIEETIRTPLMLQTVLGLESNVIASAFLTTPSAMMKKLVRAKQKIKLAQIDFEIPTATELPARIEFVAEAIFASYGKSWDVLGYADPRFSDLDDEALYLAQLLVDLLPKQPEPKGLLAFILLCESRKLARRDKDNNYIPLDEQNTEHWNHDFISTADKLLQDAFSMQKMGRFQIEAAIQSAHCARVLGQLSNWKEIVTLYNGLISIAPTLGAFVSRASAMSKGYDWAAGLEAINHIPIELVTSYQPYWALKAQLLKEAKQFPEALESYDIAIGLSEDEAVRVFLQKRKKDVS